jgi:hypothetical protein
VPSWERPPCCSLDLAAPGFIVASGVDERLARVIQRPDLVDVGEIPDQEDQQRDETAHRDSHRGDLTELLVPGTDRDQDQDHGEDREHQSRVAVLILGADRLQSLAAGWGEMEDVDELRNAEHARGPGAGEYEQRLGTRKPSHGSAWRPG